MQRKKRNDKDAKKTSGPGSGSVDGGYGWLFDRTCPECGKVFCVPIQEMWVYKDRDYLLCSWHCVRAREKRAAEKAPKRPSISGSKRLSEENVMQMQQMALEGKSITQISLAFGVSRAVVRYHVRDLKKKV